MGGKIATRSSSVVADLKSTVLIPFIVITTCARIFPPSKIAFSSEGINPIRVVNDSSKVDAGTRISFVPAIFRKLAYNFTTGIYVNEIITSKRPQTAPYFNHQMKIVKQICDIMPLEELSENMLRNTNSRRMNSGIKNIPMKKILIVEDNPDNAERCVPSKHR
jgi:hypothetical protein